MFNKLDTAYDGSAVDQNASRLVASLLVAGLLFTLILVLLKYEAHAAGLAPLISENIDLSGVTNPVTAVLLNFRAYDTLLEIAVLLIVAIAVLPIRDYQAPLFQRVTTSDQDQVILSLQRRIAPIVVMFAGYLLWAGAYQPGGAFQAGALLAGASILMFQTGEYRINYTSIASRILLAIGLAVFLTVGTTLIWFEGRLLTYPPESAGMLILLIETGATVSIAIALASLYSSLIDDSRPDAAHRPE